MNQTRTPFIASLISISLVLFFLGIFALIGIGFKLFIDNAKEEIELKALLQDGTTDAQGAAVLARIQHRPYVKHAQYLSREEVLAANEKELGKDFLKAMDGFNPYPASINIHLNADYIREDSVRKISQDILLSPEVNDVFYPITLINIVNARSTLIAEISLVVIVILTLIAYLIIINTVKLSIFSRRLIIRSMELVGATQGFIRRPFLKIGIFQGLVAGVIADGLLLLLLAVLDYNFPNFKLGELMLRKEPIMLYLSLIGFGVLLGWFSSMRAVNRYLNQTHDKLA